MRNWKVVSLGLVLCLALAASGFAATQPAAKPLRAAGKIVAVDAKTMTLEVNVGGRHEKFALAPSTQILANGKSIAATALATGEKVRIDYSMQDGRAQVSRVDVLANNAPAKSAAH